MKRNGIKLLLWIGLISLFMTNGNAQELNIYFNLNNGEVTTSGFEYNKDYNFLQYGGESYATYKGTATIKNINSIKGKAFKATKSGTSLVKGREWYTTSSYDGKTYYFSEAKKYKASDFFKVISFEEDPLLSIDLYANWNDNPKTGGEDFKANGNNGASPKETKPTSLKISAAKSSIQVGQTTTMKATFTPSGTSDTITWTSSDKKVATISSTGSVKGIKKGEVTITGKTKSGLKATTKVKVVEAAAPTTSGTYYSKIQLHMNGGTLSKEHGKNVSTSGEYLLRKGNKVVHQVQYNKNMGSTGLADVDNKNFINVTRKGYVIKKGEEWNTKKDGSGTSYSDGKTYKASDFCDSSKKDCTVTLYINWQKTGSMSIKLNTSSVTIKAGESSTVTATTTASSSIVWSSSNSNVVSVKNGTIKGLNKGSATVKASLKDYPNITAQVKVTVQLNKNKAKYDKIINNEKDGVPIEPLKKLGTVDLSNYQTNCIKVPSLDHKTSAQGFAVAGDYYVAAKRNSGDTEANIFVIAMDSSKNWKDKAKIVNKITKSDYFGHANGMTYNPNTKKLYVVKSSNGKYKTFNYSDIKNEKPSFLEGTINHYFKSEYQDFNPGGIAYSKIDNKFYLSSGSRLYVYDSTLTNNELYIKKAITGTAQDIGAYNGHILVVRWNSTGKAGDSNLEKTKNAIDLYSGSTGKYEGTYIIKSDAEMESIDYNPKTGKFAFFMQNVNGHDNDCIQEAYMNIK